MSKAGSPLDISGILIEMLESAQRAREMCDPGATLFHDTQARFALANVSDKDLGDAFRRPKIIGNPSIMTALETEMTRRGLDL